jgi:hypothetical protein
MNEPAMQRHDMVRWYNPRLLLRTGIRVASATMVGQIADYREVQAALDPIGDDPLRGAFDYSDHGTEADFWVDYVADLGDGWHSTHSVACALAQDGIETAAGTLKRGAVLIMGGDEVYPDPSAEAYEERLIAPYEDACRQVEPFEADLFATPGNHDWYDGLKAFTSVFCLARRNRAESTGRRIGCWRTHQPRSYFALKLPRGWWICGVDIQLAADLNAAQVDYFRQIAEHAMEPGDKIILCAPKPSWIFARTRRPGAAKEFTEIANIVTSGGASLRLVLAGDVHNYSRYEPDDGGATLITAGGGGAFKHPTHKLPEETALPGDDGTLRSHSLASCYPDKSRSHRLTYRNLLFPFINWEFSGVIGLVYALLVWFLETRRPGGDTALSDAFVNLMANHGSVGDALGRFFETIPKSPEFAVVLFLVTIGLVNFNLSHRRVLSAVLGVAHALCHFAALILAFCIAVQLTHMVAPQFSQLGGTFFIFLGLMVLIGGLLGGFLFGLYLIFALNVFGLQWTNCFSALRIADFNNFVRLRINADGALHVHPLKVARASRTLPTGQDVAPSPPEPIEPPIVIS